MGGKRYIGIDVLQAARQRISKAFDHTEKQYVAFSGGKDSSVLFHLVMEEAVKRGVTVGIMYIDLEAQYTDTISHARDMFEMYKENIDLHWICIPMLLRNALTQYEPQWMAWGEQDKDKWVRPMPEKCKTCDDYPFAFPGMEFEEFVPVWAQWYGEGKPTAGFIGIRAQESLHRYCAIATWEKRDLMMNDWRWTTKIVDQVYNVYPIYDWLTEDIWSYHALYPDKPHNTVYDKMQMAGVPLSQQRLCQPFGDDQRRGLWLYQILEPETWGKLVARVSGTTNGALYVQESGNVSGYNKITLPDGHTWESFVNMLLKTLPPKQRQHYIQRFKKFIVSWHKRGYKKIPDFAPPELEAKQWAPSWRRMAKVLLRNDYWCKGLGQTQPKSQAWLKFKAYKEEQKQKAKAQKEMAVVDA